MLSVAADRQLAHGQLDRLRPIVAEVERNCVGEAALVTKIGRGVAVGGENRFAERDEAVAGDGIVERAVDDERGQQPAIFQRLESQTAATGRPAAAPRGCMFPPKSHASISVKSTRIEVSVPSLIVTSGAKFAKDWER